MKEEIKKLRKEDEKIDRNLYNFLEELNIIK